MANTKIEWTEKTWNPVTGCTKCSPGCANCYAERMSKRLAGRCGYPADAPFRVTRHPERLHEPLRWRKPQMVFVCSMGDLFHDDVPDEYIDQVFAVMALCSQHTYQVLTKRPARMLEYMVDPGTPKRLNSLIYGPIAVSDWDIRQPDWPLPNVWIGVTAEDQQQADQRIPLLLQTPAAVRFVSVEPMLGPLFIRRFLDRLDWIICGGETGPGARPMHSDWPRALRDQCQAAQVPFFFKRWGEYAPNWLNDGNGNKIPGTECIDRMGKKAAGHLLDGREWRQYPEVTPCD